MNPYQLTTSVNTIVNAIARNLTVEEMTLLAAIFVQIGDTLAVIAAQKSVCENKS